MTVDERLYPVAEEACRELGLELIRVQYRGAKGGGFLSVMADKESGLTLEDCEALSHLLSDRLDELDPVQGGYSLEVTSPGPERPLRHTTDVRRFVGEKARFTVRQEDGRAVRHTGRIAGIEGEDVVLIMADSATVRFPWGSVLGAHLAQG